VRTGVGVGPGVWEGGVDGWLLGGDDGFPPGVVPVVGLGPGEPPGFEDGAGLLGGSEVVPPPPPPPQAASVASTIKVAKAAAGDFARIVGSS
jgi:hypothetical protein